VRPRAALIGAAIAAAVGLAFPVAAEELMVEACIRAASEVHKVPAGVLVLLIDVERGRLGAMSPNKNGTVDIGPMQVNDTWVDKIAERWGVSREAAFLALRDNFCANVEAGAWILQQALTEASGNLWEGVAIYHSHNSVLKRDYLRNVYEHAMRLRQQAIAELERAKTQ
jgi:hypothetical protein